MLSTGYVRTVRGLNRDTRLVIATWALSSFGTMGIDGVLGNLYILRLGFDTQYLGLLNATILLGMGLIALPSGELGRRWGYRRAMLLGLTMGTVGLALVPVALVLPPAIRGIWLTVTYVVAYLGIIIRAVNTAPYMMLATTADERNHAFAVQNAIAPAGAFLGSIAAGLLPAWFGRLLHTPADSAIPYGLSLLVAAATLAPSVVAMAMVGERRAEAPTPAEVQRGDGRAPYGLMFLLSTVFLLAALGDGPVGVFFNTYLDDGLHAPTSLIGMLMALGRLIAIPTSLAAPMLMSRLGHARTYAVTTLAAAVMLVPLAFILRWEAAAVSFVGLLAFVGLGSPAMVVFHQSLVAPRWRSTMSGIATMMRTLGLAAMSFASGAIIAHSGYSTLFRLSAGLMAVGGCLFWLLYCRPRSVPREADEAA
ncbi:MAG: MFS transporter [Anaerolineae bacterium]